MIASVALLSASVPRAKADQVSVDNTKTLWECGITSYGGFELCGSAAAVLYKDSAEQDPANDYYAVKVTVQNQNAASSIEYIGEIWVDLTFPSAAQESPSNHQPGPGCGITSTGLTFSFYGITFPLAVPGTCTDYSTNLDSSGFHVHWHQCSFDGGCPANPVTHDYSEFGVGVTVPEGSAIPVSIHVGLNLIHHFGGGGAVYTNADVAGSLYACCTGSFQTFGLVPSPNTLSVQAGTDGSSTITLTSYNGYSGTITLTATVTPGTSPGPQVLLQGSVYLPAGGSIQVPVSIQTDYSTPQYSYHIQINAGDGSISHQDTIQVVVGSPPPAPTYLFPATFTAGGTSGSHITVCVGSYVSVSINLYATTTVRGTVSMDIRRDIVWYSDNTLTTLSKTVVVNGGNNAVNMGSFSASDLTGGGIGDTAQYFIKVYWAGQTIYDPTDPNSREWVQTTYCGCGCGGGGGSPWIAVRDSSGRFTFTNDVLRGGLFSQGQAWHDTSDYYLLPTPGVPENGQYIYLVQERNTAVNYLDQFSAYAVDHPADTNVVTTLDGKVLTYGSPSSALTVTDAASGASVDVTGKMARSLTAAINDDGITAGVYVGPGHTMYADLGAVSESEAKLIAQGAVVPGTVGCFNCRTGIWVSVQARGGWTTAGQIFFRKGGSVEGLDLSPYVKNSGQSHVKVKLTFIGGQRIDFIGLDKTPSPPVTITRLPMTIATFESQTDVTAKLASGDNNYLVYGALEYFTVRFTNAPPPTNGLVRDILVVTTGHYIT